ncbi:hypothetical protein CN918_29385 [Priestia megaterium]|nr:hypothetical protein CN918_29385 [Priestia megaterium]
MCFNNRKAKRSGRNIAFTNEQFALIKQAYTCLEKVADEVPFQTEGVDAEQLWKAFMALSVIVDK